MSDNPQVVFRDVRATDREATVVLRTSRENKQRIIDDAKEAGISVQALLERRVLGIHDATDRRAGRKPKDRSQQELFKMTG